MLNNNYKIITNNEKIWVNLNINFLILNISLFVYFSFNQLLTNTSYMFNECSSLTSLNLSNFNTNNVNNMVDIFKFLNINCEVISNDNQILEQVKSNKIIKIK